MLSTSSSPKRKPRWERGGYASPQEYRQDKRIRYGTNSSRQRSRDYAETGASPILRYPTPEEVLAAGQQHAVEPCLFPLGEQVRLVIVDGWEIEARIVLATVNGAGRWLFQTDASLMRYVTQADLVRWNNPAGTRAIVPVPKRFQFQGHIWEGDAAERVAQRVETCLHRYGKRCFNVIKNLPPMLIGFPPAAQ